MIDVDRLPTIHKGGTSREELIDQCLHAIQKLQGALAALHAAVPRSCDYVHRHQAWATSFGAHRQKITTIQNMILDLAEIAEAIRQLP